MNYPPGINKERLYALNQVQLMVYCLNYVITFNNDIHSYKTRSSKVLHIRKENTTRFAISSLSFNDVKL